jgi:hypothetical protein
MPTSHAHSLQRIEMRNKRRDARSGDLVGMAPLVRGQFLNQTQSLEPIKGPVESAGPERETRDALDVLNEGVPVLRTISETRQNQN